MSIELNQNDIARFNRLIQRTGYGKTELLLKMIALYEQILDMQLQGNIAEIDNQREVFYGLDY